MADIITGAGVNALGNLATEYSSPYVAYFFRYGRIEREFKQLQKQLELRKVRVENDVDVAKRQTQIIEDDVLDWLKRAEEELGAAKVLADKVDGHYKCLRWCPSLGWRYCLSMKVAKKNIDISRLLEASEFSRVGRPSSPLQGTEPISVSKDVNLPESSKLALKRIFEAFKKNDNADMMIGVYGMPGVGKTTLAKQVGNQARQSAGFDKVVMFTVSQNPNINEIQDRIAEIFGLKFEVNTLQGRAEVLRRRLSEDVRLEDEKNILIIADDVWGEVRLPDFGIPFGGSKHNGIKVLLTTRLEQVCIRMDCQDKFRVETLCEDEAWSLFKQNAGLKDGDAIDHNLAKEVCRECKGLPLAVVTIAKTLKGASPDEWEAASKRLKESIPLDDPEVCKGLYECLQFSYDYLKDKNIQSCFLLCSLFPEDYNISIEMLTMCAMGQELFCDIYQSIEDLRREINVALMKLRKSGLLLESFNPNHVRMHDVVRDFAHWKTSSRGENTFMVKDGLMEWPKIKSLDRHIAVALWNSKINYFPDKLEFPKLKTLILKGSWYSTLNVPSAFVKGMKVLEVLILQDVVFSGEAFQFLKNLRVLSLEGCELHNVPLLRNLEDLEVLVLLKTKIFELHDQVMELHIGKTLYTTIGDASDQTMAYFPPNLLSRLKSSLQELALDRANNMNLFELNSLSRLTALTLRVSCAELELGFQENLVFPNLSRLNIAVTDDDNWSPYASRGNFTITLSITNKDYSSLGALKKLFRNVERLELREMVQLKSIFPNLVDHIDGELNELIWLRLKSCKDMECLVDTTSTQEQVGVFSNLVELRIEKMPCFTEWFRGDQPPPAVFLQKLRTLLVNDCPIRGVINARLDTLYWVDFQNCLELKTVFRIPKDGLTVENGETGILALEFLTLKNLPELEMIWQVDEPARLAISLQRLKTVTIDCCKKLKSSIFPSCAAQTTLWHLQEVHISECLELEQVFSFDQHHVTTISTDQEEYQTPALGNLTKLDMNSLPKLSCIWTGATITHKLVSLGSLRTVEIRKCEKLPYLFPPTLAQTLEHMEQLTIEDCESLEYLIMESSELEDGHEIVEVSKRNPCCWPKLKSLKIKKCKSLEYVFSPTLAQTLEHLEDLLVGECESLEYLIQESKSIQVSSTNSSCCWPKLETLDIYDCDSLKYVFPQTLAQTLEHLQHLTIANCKSLEYLIMEYAELEDINVSKRKPCCWPKMETLKITTCESLKYVFPITLALGLSCLQLVMVAKCGKLEHVFGMAEEEMDDVSNSGDHTIVLPQLHFLHLKKVESLSSFCPTNYFVRLPSLKYFKVSRRREDHFHDQSAMKDVGLDEVKELLCNARYLFQVVNQKDLIPNVDPEGLNGLNFLLPRDGKKLECSIDKDTTVVDELGQIVSTNALNNLVELVIDGLIGLKMLCKGTSTEGIPIIDKLKICNCLEMEMVSLSPVLQNVEELKVVNCGKLKQILPIDEIVHDSKVNQAPLMSNLAHLELHSVPELQWICREGGGTHCVNFQRLTVVKISYCHRLKYLFSPSLAQSLVLLEDLRISDCNALEHIIATELECAAEIDGGGDIVLPRLQFLILEALPSLSSFGPKNCFVKLPSLKEFKVCTLTSSEDQRRATFLTITMEDVELYRFEQFLRNAKDLVMNRVIYEKNLIPNVDHEELNELNFLELKDGEGLEFLIDTTINEGHIVSNNAFTNLVELVIDGMTGLKMLCNGTSTEGILPRLEKLVICNCLEMEMVSFYPMLQNIKELKVVNCGKLQQVFQIDDEINIVHDSHENQAPLLPNLTTLFIIDCPNLEYVFQITTSADCAIVLPRLRQLLLYNLKTLTSFVSNNYPIVFPSLGELAVSSCPRLVNFTLQKQVTRTCRPLQELYLSDLRDDKGSATINFQLKQGSVNLESITVANCERIFHIQDGHYLSRLVDGEQNLIQTSTFQYLRELNVSNCNGLKSLFPPLLAQNLLALTNLERSDCEGLEVIIEMDQTFASSSSSSQDHLQPRFLPSLHSLRIDGCNNLKSLLPSSVIRNHNPLKTIVIDGASKLEQVFGHYGEPDVEDHDKKKKFFLHLRELRLFELPSLKSFGPMSYKLRFPWLRSLEINGCPELNTCFAKDSGNVVVHAITQVPQQIQSNEAESSTRTEGMVHNHLKTCNDINWDHQKCPDTLPLYASLTSEEK